MMQRHFAVVAEDVAHFDINAITGKYLIRHEELQSVD